MEGRKYQPHYYNFMNRSIFYQLYPRACARYASKKGRCRAMLTQDCGKMIVSKAALLLCCLYSTFYTFRCVNAVTTNNAYLLEFITQNPASETAMIYGFQLLEDIRQIRMACEERRDTLEQEFTVELQNWILYSKQTQQIMAKPDFEEHYTTENRHTIENTISNTYKELFLSRARRLKVVEHQCNDKLEYLLHTREKSMLILVVNLISRNMDELNTLVSELRSYSTKLQDGLEKCIQSMQYGSELSSKILSPDEYCSSPDIEILVAFLDRMLNIIMEEQALFFDDEDLGMDTPCFVSGCDNINDASSNEKNPSTADIQPTLGASLHSPTVATPQDHQTMSTQIQEDTQHPHSSATSRPITSTEPEGQTTTQDTIPPSLIPSSASTSDITIETIPELPTDSTSATTHDNKQQPSTELQATTGATSSEFVAETKSTLTESITRYDLMLKTKQPITDGEFSSSTLEPESKQTPTHSEYLTTSTDTITPEWLNDAINEVLGSQKHTQSEHENTPEQDQTESRSGHHGGHNDDNGDYEDSNSRDDSVSEYSTMHNEDSGVNYIIIDIPPDAKKTKEESSTGQNNIYRLLIYSFTTTGGILMVATIGLVAAILVVHHKRRQLLGTQMLSQEQKISIMKQTGYINPTYKFFDKQIDG